MVCKKQYKSLYGIIRLSMKRIIKEKSGVILLSIGITLVTMDMIGISLPIMSVFGVILIIDGIDKI